MTILRGRRLNGHPQRIVVAAGGTTGIDDLGVFFGTLGLTSPPLAPGVDDLGVFVGNLGTTSGAPSVAASYTMTQSASSGTTGTADTLTFAPVGDNWPTATITITVSGMTATLANGSGGTLSGSVLAVPSGTTTSCTVTMTPSTTGTATINATNSAGMANPGGLTYTASSSGGGTPTTSVAFTRTNTSGSATSLGFKQRGVWFAKGEIPSGYIPSFSGGPAQFYRTTFWSDGSLKRAVMVSRETSYSAGEARSLALTATTGSYAQTGTGTLSGAVSGHDFKVTFASVTQTDYANAVTTRGSGSFTASLSSHLSITTRVTKIAGGGVADVFTCWGMAQDNTGGAGDSWLKVNWTISRFKNADGSTAFIKVGAEVANDWWSVSGGRLLSYNAILKDGATTLLTFNGVQHPCQSRWLMCINDGSALAGTVPIVGATTPTLHDAYDRAHWINTNLIPPVKLTTVPGTTTAIPTYTPCDSMEHRAAIDGTGDYMGRGQLPSCDTDAILRQDALAYARSRINALAGLGVTYHYRSNNTRTRPGESADIANTSISLIMAPKASSAYTFTADGMPAPVDAYADARSGSAHMDGRSASQFAGASTDTVQGGSGVWQPGGDASHAVAYSYFMALVEGDEWWLEATIDLALNTAHQCVYGFHQGRGLLYAGESDYSSLSIPTTAWSGLLGQWEPDNSRSMAWSQLLIGHMAVVTGTDHVAFNYVRELVQHNGDYIAGNLSYMPADHVAAGLYTPVSQLGLPGLEVPFFFAIKSMCSHDNYLKTEDTRWKNLGDHCFHYTAAIASAGRWYQLEEYKCMDRRRKAGWANGTNPILAPTDMGFLNAETTLNAGTGFFSISGIFFNSENSTLQFTNGDQVCFTTLTQNGAGTSIPVGATEGQVAYVRDLTGTVAGVGSSPTPATFKLSSRADLGDLLTWTTSGTANMTWNPQQCGAYTVAQNPPFVPLSNGFAVMGIAAIAMARRTANAQATSAMWTAAATFSAPIDYTTYSQFALTP